jgi:hypothetical protein
VSVELDSQNIVFSTVSLIRSSEINLFNEVTGWAVLIGLIFGSVLFYFVALGVSNFIRRRIERNGQIKVIENDYRLIYEKYFRE